MERTYAGIDITIRTAKLYNCRIEKVQTSYAITGSSGGTVILGECSLEGNINSVITTTYKKILK